MQGWAYEGSRDHDASQIDRRCCMGCMVFESVCVHPRGVCSHLALVWLKGELDPDAIHIQPLMPAARVLLLLLLRQRETAQVHDLGCESTGILSDL